MSDNRISASLAGLYQTVALALYVTLVVAVMRFLDGLFDGSPEMPAMIMMLLLLVLSAAISALAVFGYPAYLAMRHKVREALAVLGYTFIYVIFLLIAFIFIMQI